MSKLERDIWVWRVVLTVVSAAVAYLCYRYAEWSLR